MSLASLADTTEGYADEVALIDRSRQWTWAEVADRAASLTHDEEDSRSDRWIVDGDASPESAIRVFAALEPGRIAFLRHPRWATRRRTAVTSLAGPAWDVDAGRPVDGPAHPVRDADAAAVVFTSGSTGAPRGVVLSRSGMAASASASAANLGWRPGDRWLLCLPTAHVGGLSILARCREVGAGIVCVPDFEPDGIIDAIDRRRASLASFVPTMLRRILDECPDWSPPAHLRAVLVGGAATPPTLVAEARRRGLPLLLTWGLTEAGSQVCTQDPTRALSLAEHDLQTCGRPLAGFEVTTRDGRLHVRGRAVSRTWFPAEAHPLGDDGYLPTNDAGFLTPPGDVRVSGRVDDVILTGGENVHPATVEAVLAEHEAVAECCVVGEVDERWGQRVAAVVVWRGRPVDWSVLATHARGRLAPFAVPRAWHAIDRLPLGTTGKVDRHRVAEEIAAAR